MVLFLLNPLIFLLVCSFSYQKAFAKEKIPDFFRLFMLSSKLDPIVKEWICTLYCIFVEFWRNICYFFTFYYYNLVKLIMKYYNKPLICWWIWIFLSNQTMSEISYHLEHCAKFKIMFCLFHRNGKRPFWKWP